MRRVNDLPLHRGKSRHQAILLTVCHAGAAECLVEIFRERIEFGCCDVQLGVSGVHIPTRVVTRAAADLAQLFIQKSFELADVSLCKREIDPIVGLNDVREPIDGLLQDGFATHGSK
jgi:hypothetical protein